MSIVVLVEFNSKPEASDALKNLWPMHSLIPVLTTVAEASMCVTAMTTS